MLSGGRTLRSKLLTHDPQPAT